MHLLQRYILKELVRVLALVLSLLTVLLVFVGVFREATASGLGLAETLSIIPYIVPSMLPYTIPSTMLLTVCMVYGRLGADYEITAAKASGISVISLLMPAFVLSGVLSVSTLLLCDQVIPWSVAKIQRVISLAMEDIFLDMLASQSAVKDRERGMAISAVRVDKAEHRLVKPNIRYSPSGKEPVVVQADEATVRIDVDQQTAIIHFKQAWIDAPGGVTLKLDDQEFAFPMAGLRKNEVRSRNLNLNAIQRQLVELKEQSQAAEEQRAISTAFTLALGHFNEFTEVPFQHYHERLRMNVIMTNKHRTEVQNRFALSCSCIFFALLGSPFAVLQARSQFLTNFFLCFLPILLVYYPVVLLMMNLSITGKVNPAIAMWLGNFLLFIGASVVLKKAIQH